MRTVNFDNGEYIDLCILQHLELQSHVVDEVVLGLLCDDDGRVRHAAAQAVCR